MILKPNIAAVLSLGAWRAGLTGAAGGAGVAAGVRDALDSLSFLHACEIKQKASVAH
jgi:hypothetical protein